MPAQPGRSPSTVTDKLQPLRCPKSWSTQALLVSRFPMGKAVYDDGGGPAFITNASF
jgi:hypothetical protein